MNAPHSAGRADSPAISRGGRTGRTWRDIRDIEHLDEVLIAVEQLPPQRFQVFLKRGRAAFKPAIPPMGHFELSIMKDTIKRLTKGKVTPAAATVW
jgi:hypothetical protein